MTLDTSMRMLQSQKSCFESFMNQLSIYPAVSNWCEQFDLEEEETGQEKLRESVTKGVLTYVKFQGVKLLVSYPRPASGNSLREITKTSNHCPNRFDSQGFANSHRSGTGYRLV